MGDEMLVEAAATLATSIRMGEGIDLRALSRFREELASAAEGWQSTDQIPRKAAAVLVEIYPALAGSLGLYVGEEAVEITDLAEELLDEILRLVAG